MAKSEKPANPKRKGTPHNDFFIQQWSDLKVAQAFFKEYLPASIQAIMDWSQLRLAPGDFVQKALQNRKSDLLYETRFKGSEGQEIKGFFLIHFEHQKEPDETMCYRYLSYLVGIYEQYLKQFPKEGLPIVFPITLFQGPKKWTAALHFHDFLSVPEALKPYVPSFEYHLVDLSGMSDDQIKGSLFLRVFLMIMKHIDSPELSHLLASVIWPLFEKLFEEGSGLRYLEDVLYYLFKASSHLNEEEVAQQVQNLLSFEDAQEVIMTIAEQLEQKGRQKGLQEGRQEGRQEGESNLLKKLLQKKFGEAAESYQAILATLSVDELETLGERLITQSTLEDIFQGFPWSGSPPKLSSNRN